MIRVLSGLVLLVLVIGVVWAAPAWATLALGCVVLALGLVEYAALAERGGPPLPRVLMAVAALATAFACATPGVPVEVPLVAALITLGGASVGAGNPEEDVVRRVAVALFPVLYLGVPLGTMGAMRSRWGPEVLLLLFLTVVASDTGQYYAGRLFGRRKLSPAISPKKTVEGAVGGFLAGAIVFSAVGAWWLPSLPLPLRALLGVTIVALGIVGDLFESLLKRSAGVKDSSGLIPGHGGMLDRVDSLLFAAPVYYVVLLYVLE